jgi:hypothetical protein
MNCSGCHRHIGFFLFIKKFYLFVGTNYTKVKSTNMDHWSAEQVNFMVSMGNTKANQFWEGNINFLFNILFSSASTS